MGLSYYVSGSIVDEMIESWGDNLEHLYFTEKLWLISNFLDTGIDWNDHNDRGVVEAEEEIRNASRSFKIKVIYSFCKYLTEEFKPLSYYLSDREYSEWIDSAMETWGERLEYFPENSGLIMLYNLTTSFANLENLPHQDELEECLEVFKNQESETQGKLISAIAELAYEHWEA